MLPYAVELPPSVDSCLRTFPHQVNHLAGVCVPLCAELGVDLPSINRYFKLTLAAPHQCDSGQIIPELPDDFIRQTDGSWTVVSFLAIYYFNLHPNFLLPTFK